jgi:hypothetical protein
MAGHVEGMGKTRSVNKMLVGKPAEKRPLGRPRRRWEDNSNMGLWEIRWEDVYWIHLAQDRDQWRAFVNMIVQFDKVFSGYQPR